MPTGELPARRRVIAAARRYFFAHGLRGASMDDLARELGMSKKTLYSHFPSKAALLEAVLLEKSRSIGEDLDRISAESSSDFPAALHELLACVQRHGEEIQPPFLRDLQREAPEMFGLVERRRRDHIQRYFTKLLDEGRKAGVIRRDIPVKLIIEILLAATQAIMNPPKMAELGLVPKTGYPAIIRVILEGAIAREGRAKR